MPRRRRRIQKRKPIGVQVETTTNDDGSGTEGSEPSFIWTNKRVLALLNSMIRRKPAGIHKHVSMILIKADLCKRLNMDVPMKEIWKFLNAHWDMEKADKIEFQVTKLMEEKDFELPQTEDWKLLIEEQLALIREAENKNKDAINQTRQAATSNVDLKTLKSVKIMVEKIDCHSMFMNRFKSNK